MQPDISRYCAEVMHKGRARVDLSGSSEAVLDRLQMQWRVEHAIREAGSRARRVADLPQWLLDLGDQLGVERPVDVIRSDGPDWWTSPHGPA